MTPATDIITRLIGYAGHDEDCSGRFYKESWDGLVCACGYSAAIADARQFLEGESALNKMIVGLDIGDISHSSIVRVDYSSDGIPTYTPIPAESFINWKEIVMASEIKPCPFCGTSMVVVTKDTLSHPGTVGGECLMAGKSYYWEHIDWWNTRAGEAEAAYIEAVAKLDKAVEALENIRDIEKPVFGEQPGRDWLAWYSTASQMAELADDALITAKSERDE